MSGSDPVLLDAARRILRAVADPQTRRDGDAAAVWRALDEAGLPRAWLFEESGGAGASLGDGFAILRLAGEVALDLPLAETLLAGWLIAAAGLRVPDGALTSGGADDGKLMLGGDGRNTGQPGGGAAALDASGGALTSGSVALGGDGRLSGQLSGAAFARGAAARDASDAALASGSADAGSVVLGGGGRLSGQLSGVAFARGAAAIAVIARRGGEPVVAVVDRAACEIRPRDNLAGEPRDTVVLDGVVPAAVAAAPAGLYERWWAMGAVARSCQIAGALQGILARTVTYAGERIAFDRPLAKFQAIQHALARLAGEAAVVLAAAGSAADALAAGASGDALLLEVASAKIRAGEAAATGAAIAHQVHGAIGFSTEHPLHRFTRRLWAWRDDFGSETAWAIRLGAEALRWGDELWPVIAAR